MPSEPCSAQKLSDPGWAGCPLGGWCRPQSCLLETWAAGNTVLSQHTRSLSRRGQRPTCQGTCLLLTTHSCAYSFIPRTFLRGLWSVLEKPLTHALWIGLQEGEAVAGRMPSWCHHLANPLPTG